MKLFPLAASCLLILLGLPLAKGVGLLDLLDFPKHDGVNRVCHLATGTVLSEAASPSIAEPLVVRVVDDKRLPGNRDGFQEDFFQVAAQLTQTHRFCDVSESALKDGSAPGAVSVGQVYLYRSGRRVPYYGRRTASALLSWIQKMVQPPISVITGKLDKAAFDQVLQMKLVGFFMEGTADYAAFEEASIAAGNSVLFYAVFDRNVARHLRLDTVGQIALYSPLMKHSIICPKNPAGFQDIVAFIAEHRNVSLTRVDEHNVNDPGLEDPSRVTVLAVADQSTPIGGYLLRLLYRTMKNVTNTTSATRLNILWIDPAVLPATYTMMQQLGQTGNPPHLGTHDVVTGQGQWFDMSLLNVTGRKEADEENVQKLLDFFAGLATSQPEQGSSFTEVPASQAVPPGSSVVLRCSARQPAGDCLWLKDGRNVGFNLDRLPHLSWAGDRTAGDCSLAITNVLKGRDDGSWVCEITGDAQHPTITSPPAVIVVSETAAEDVVHAVYDEL